MDQALHPRLVQYASTAAVSRAAVPVISPVPVEPRLAGTSPRRRAAPPRRGETRTPVPFACAPFRRGPRPTGLRKLVARLHLHPVISGAPADVFQRQRHVCRHACLPVRRTRQRAALTAEARGVPPIELGLSRPRGCKPRSCLGGGDVRGDAGSGDARGARMAPAGRTGCCARHRGAAPRMLYAD